jgi:serine-type D-Ala-D-Ala carboxypeptidase
MKVTSKPSIPLSSLQPELEKALERLFAEAIEERTFPGASLLVGGPGRHRFERSWGRTHYEDGTAVGAHTRFDLASLTKPLVTTALCLWAVGEGHLQLESPLSRFIPRGLLPASKTEVTLFQLLNHCSGLPAYESFYRELILIPDSQRSHTLLSWILQTPLHSPPGKRCLYSDLGFMLLGILLEKAFGCPLDDLASQHVLAPLDINELAYRRLRTGLHPTLEPCFEEPAGDDETCYAPTEDCPWRQRLLIGEVHDENGYCLDGVAGHAGLFGTAKAIFQLLSHLLDVYRGVVCDGKFKREDLHLFWEKPSKDPESTWALGFDTPSSTGSSAGRHFSTRTVGHLGFTGTSFWIDLERELIVILLTNRVHPTRVNDRIKAFRPLVHDLVMEGLHDHSER